MPPKNDQAEQKAEKNDAPNGLDALALQRQLQEMGDLMKVLQARVDAQGGNAPAPKKIEKTEKDGQYVATARGHIPGIGIIEPGQKIPADIPISENWMKKAPKRKPAEDEDADEADEA